jgi:hypothetical protein
MKRLPISKDSGLRLALLSSQELFLPTKKLNVSPKKAPRLATRISQMGLNAPWNARNPATTSKTVPGKARLTNASDSANENANTAR